MNLGQVLVRLANAELSNLSMSGPDGAIIAQARPKVVTYVNEGLLRLHSRMVLRESTLLLRMHEQITEYHLKAEFAESYQPEEGEESRPYRYIVDGTAPEPFADDVIRVTTVFDSLGREYELNNPLAPASLFTPRPKVLQVPIPVAGQALAVTYQATHPRLFPNLSNNDDEVQLPEVLVGALTAYVGYMAFNFLGGQENMARANGFLADYEKICVEMEGRDGMGTNTRSRADTFEQKGFV